MARYTITYKCGHTEEMQLFGKYDDRQRKIDYYKTIDCPHCRALAAQASAETAGLPALQGSDKQIAWATDIRNKAISLGEELYNMRGAKKETIKLAMDYLLSHTNASFWIENNTELTKGSIIDFAKFVGTLYLNK